MHTKLSKEYDGGFIIKRLIFTLAIVLLILTTISCASADDFDDLASEISNANDTVVLTHDYHTTNESSQIVISKSVTIDGANHNIEAPDVERVFFVNASDVTIKNINFINAKRSALAGGAISWMGDNGALINCSFENCSAISAGGALLWSADNGLIENCSFKNNNVGYGPAASLTCALSYDPSQIHIQIVNAEGGALYIKANNITVKNSNFLNNTALLNGGAVSVDWSRNVTISSSRFKHNKAQYNGGAIDLSGENITVSSSLFGGNDDNDIFNNCPNTNVINSIFENESKIDGFFNVKSSDVIYGDMDSFDELQRLVNSTEEGGILFLDSDYAFLEGQNKGVLISKSITIDGQGHTLNGRELSRMFNITSDNVTIKNLNFINGNAFGQYFTQYVGGGAIYWSGNHGKLENCNFTSNQGSGIEDDPFDKEESIILDDGTVMYTIRVRPMGAKINEGGAIVWNGTDGYVNRCIFKDNGVGYPNSGGAIMWRGDRGKIENSQFYHNDAWAGSAICWTGDNGTLLSSIIANHTFFDGGIYWFGENATIHNTVLLGNGFRNVLYAPTSMDADYNFWGDTVKNPNQAYKPGFVKNWLLVNLTHDGEFVNINDTILVQYAVNSSIDSKGIIQAYDNITYEGAINYTAPKTGYLNVTFTNTGLNVYVDSLVNIKCSNLVKYYTKTTTYKVTLSDISGKLINKTVKFNLNGHAYYVKTDKNGVATLKVSLKPGKYTIKTTYGKTKVSKKITVKTTLITKNLSKKVKRTAKFNVKVLNSKGKPYSKKLVKVTFKGKTYKIKTNSKGIASLKISNKLKVGKYTIKTSCNGLTNTNKVTVKK